MAHVKSIITNGLLTLVLCLTILATVFVVNDAQALKADAAEQVGAAQQVVYLQLTDAPPVRDISQQRIAPLQ